MTYHVHWCRGCRRCKPIDDFPTAGAALCIPCKATSDHVRAAKAKALTPHQAQIADLMCLGKTNEEIAMILNRSPLTVKGHVHVILDKLDANNRTYAAVKYAVRKLKEEI